MQNSKYVWSTFVIILVQGSSRWKTTHSHRSSRLCLVLSEITNCSEHAQLGVIPTPVVNVNASIKGMVYLFCFVVFACESNPTSPHPTHRDCYIYLHCIQCQVSNNGFLAVWFGLAMVLSIVWPRTLLLCPFHKKLRISEKKSYGFCQTGNPQFSFIVYFYTYWQLTWRNLEVSEFSFLRKSTKKKSLVIRTWYFPQQYLFVCLFVFLELQRYGS